MKTVLLLLTAALAACSPAFDQSCEITRPLDTEVACHVKAACSQGAAEMLCFCGNVCLCFFKGKTAGMKILASNPPICVLDDEALLYLLLGETTGEMK